MEKIENYSPLLKEAYTMIKHDSGLRVYVFPKELTTMYALLAVQYGSLDSTFSSDGAAVEEVPDGIAHFLEHKLFDSPDGKDVLADFSALGADANAYTTYNRTAYLFSCTERFSDALGELLKFVTTPYFTKESVQKEQGIIAEEIRMYEDIPWERGYQNLLGALFPDHPVRKSICGTVRSIQKITPELLYRCYRAFYRLSNMALVVCGSVSEDEVLRVVDEALGALQPSEGIIQKILPHSIGKVKKHLISCRMQVAKPIFSIGWKDSVLLSNPKERLHRDFCMSLLNEVLFSQAGEFYSELFEQGIITPSFSCGYSSAESFAFHCIVGESDTPDTVLERLYAYLDKVRQTGISKEAFERCRRVLYADEIRAYDSTEEIANRLVSFVFDGAELFDAPSVLEEITIEELQFILEQFYQKDMVSMSVVFPLEEQ